ncbi:alkaline phosphatase [Ferrimonas pelagia]|uniref:Alkaline phosphatase n=1 Tax=Ferrimonas pelagia TaxID=1177826 RepID=A0ABP9EH48_9GAMM
MNCTPLAALVSVMLLTACSPQGAGHGDAPAPAATQMKAQFDAPATPVTGQLGLDGRTLDETDPWYQQGQDKVAQLQALTPITERARNVVLFVGDGMSVTTITAARILAGQLQGENGEGHMLSFDEFPYTAMVKTYNTDAQVPDSAGTMSAIVTGVKTRAGVLSVSEQVARRDCASFGEHRLMTNMMMAAQAGMATGVVTNTRITHATPAATYAWSPDRNYESDGDITNWGKQVGCVDIATQLVEFDYGRGLDVAFGGGRQQFLPKEQADPIYPGVTGKRKDGRDLTQVWQQRHADSIYVDSLLAMEALPADGKTQALGLFAPSHNAYRVDRLASESERSIQPSLEAMTSKALELLQARDAQDGQGFMLVVESGRIDHGHHAGNAHRALHEVIELDEAVAAVMAAVGEDTLVLVTADHSHTLSMAGYSAIGNPILGLAGRPTEDGGHEPMLDGEQQPFTTLAYANGPGANYPTASLTQESVMAPDYRQRAVTPMDSETHAGEDVILHAVGPGAQLARGTLEQNVIFHIIDQALGLSERVAAMP